MPTGTPGAFTELIMFPLRFAYAPPLLVLCLRLGSVRSRIGEALLWAFTIAGAILMPIGGEEIRGAVITIWSAVYLGALIVLLLWLIAARA